MEKQKKYPIKRVIHFTDRQITVLQNWAQYATIAEVATNLQISENTVQTQLKRMRKKLGVTRTFDVYKYAQERGWLE